MQNLLHGVHHLKVQGVSQVELQDLERRPQCGLHIRGLVLNGPSGLDSPCALPGIEDGADDVLQAPCPLYRRRARSVWLEP